MAGLCDFFRLVSVLSDFTILTEKKAEKWRNRAVFQRLLVRDLILPY